MPPAPSRDTTSYAPSRVPGARAMASGWNYRGCGDFTGLLSPNADLATDFRPKRSLYTRRYSLLTYRSERQKGFQQRAERGGRAAQRRGRQSKQIPTRFAEGWV